MRSQTTEKPKSRTSQGSRQQNKNSNPVQQSFNIGDFLMSTKQQTFDETQIQHEDSFEKYRSLLSKAKIHLDHKNISIKKDGIKKNDFFITSTKFQALQNYQVDDQDIQFQNHEKEDDLKELRKMIRRTKKNMSTFGDSLYDLNKCIYYIFRNVQTLNTKANVHGFGVKDYVFDAMNYSLKRKTKK